MSIIEIFSYLFSLTPLNPDSLTEIIGLWAVYFGLSLTALYVVSALPLIPVKEPKRPPIKLLIPASVGEELIFRGIPVWLNLPHPFMFTIIWAVIHVHPANIAFCLIQGVFYYRLWIGGAWPLAIIFHLLNNTLMTALIAKTEKE